MKRALFLLFFSLGSSAERSTARLDDHCGASGRFRIDLGREAAVLHGKIVDPVPDPWTAVRGEGDCELVVRNPTMDRGLPVEHVVGVVTLTTGARRFEVKPVAKNYAALLPRRFETLRLEATGGEIAPFELATRGIRPLEDVTANANRIAWRPGDAATQIRVKLTLGPDREVRCLTTDDGELAIASKLVEGELQRITVTRELVTSTITALGRIELVVASELEI